MKTYLKFMGMEGWVAIWLRISSLSVGISILFTSYKIIIDMFSNNSALSFSILPMSIIMISFGILMIISSLLRQN